MQVNQDFNPVFLRPLDSVEEIGVLALVVRLATRNVKRPVTYWNTDVVQTASQKFIVSDKNQHAKSAYPATAIALKSDSVIQVSQWALSLAWAAFESWSWPNLYN